MCGISGIFNLRVKQAIDADLVRAINRVQAHRGPDDEGYYVDEWLGLGHRRLSIIDLASGHQPMFNEDQSVCVIFNGEIYNFAELVAELSFLGHQFATHSDTEVIVHAWEQWGADCLTRFRGMFAFALWDKNQRTLFIARDPLGKKPLFYTETARGQLVFGSELKVLLAHPEVDRTLRTEMAEEYFMYGYLPDPYSAYQHIYKLEAGHYLQLTPNGKVTPTQYWDVPELDRVHSWQDIQAELIERFSEAVRIRMLSDVPLGAFLSGGVDSSAVTAMMANAQSAPVNTFAMGFTDPVFDESQYASQVASRYHTKHVSEIVTANQCELVDKLTDIFDEPFADSSALPTYQLCKLARKHVKVALSGDGGDEIFAGYRRQRLHLAEQRFRDRLPLTLRQPLFGALGRVYPKADWAPKFLRAKTTFQSLAMNEVDGYANTMSKLRTEQRQALFSPRYWQALDGYNGVEIMRKHAKAAPTDDPLKRIQYLDMKTWLSGDILTKADRTSMANSLELRSPLLDSRFVSWAFLLNSQDNIRGSEGKYAFKKMLEPHLDKTILYRNKMGFSMPVATWFRTELKHRIREAVLSTNMQDCGYFNPSYLQKLLDEHQSGQADHADSLWCLLMFATFINRQ